MFSGLKVLDVVLLFPVIYACSVPVNPKSESGGDFNGVKNQPDSGCNSSAALLYLPQGHCRWPRWRLRGELGWFRRKHLLPSGGCYP